ncbi:MAG TPA: motility protein A, partial [Clostridiales bacterium]|nr:motility protein A [Clostridiales bacterium]
ATSLGLLGTYVGLIPMLINLEDPTRLGPLMAVELVTSFYGAFISYILFTPMSRRLKNMSRDEVTRKELVIEGLVAIQENQNPRRIRDSLMAFLSKKD